jgi:hypothetical protein
MLENEIAELKNEVALKNFEIQMLKNEARLISDLIEKEKSLNYREDVITAKEKHINTELSKIYFYDKLIEIIKDNEHFRKEWTTLMAMLKLTLDEDKIRELSGR